MQKIVPEIDVLIACSLWLHQKGVLPLSFSIASGYGIETSSNKQRLKKTLEDAGYSTSMLQFRLDGADVTAISRSEFWQIECKGAGQGKQPTQRNNFDRALASTVSYYIDQSPQFSGELSILNSAVPFLGLALPATRDYLDQLQKRVQSALRKRLNLWVLLYDSIKNTIIPVSPDDAYPKSQADLSTKSPSQNQKSDGNKEAREFPKPIEATSAVSTEPRRRLVNPRPIVTTIARSNSGESLNRKWQVGARHALYHRDGTWFMPIERFPGAYFDPNGYVLFRTKQEYLGNPYLRIGERVNVRGGISRIPGYKKMR